MENYFNYFTEIEEQFQRRRGGILLLSTLDWALIETWKDAGIPLEAVLRGIDGAFERYEKRPTARKVNSLAYCAQEVLAAAEEMKEAAVGACRAAISQAQSRRVFRLETSWLFCGAMPTCCSPQSFQSGPGFQAWRRRGRQPAHCGNWLPMWKSASPRLEDLERRLTVLEEKLFAVLLAATPDDEIVAVRAEADRELSPYRRKMPAAQIDQLQKQYVHKRLLEKYGLPRLSLFYM